jgi:hypothetical protein
LIVLNGALNGVLNLLFAVTILLLIKGHEWLVKPLALPPLNLHLRLLLRQQDQHHVSGKKVLVG